LITEVIAIGYAVRPAGQLVVGDIHTRETRQRRRNELSAKALEAFDQVYEIAQTEALAEANELRIAAFEVLAHLAEVNSSILRDASEEEILAEMEKLREEQRNFEAATRELEEQAGELATKK
jgi:regulator of RNase E activity RraB